MKILGKLFIGFLFCTAGLLAQAQEAPPVLPVELYGCSLAGTSDMGDVEGSFDELNEWADERGIDDLTIYQLTPSFVSADNEFDVISFNIWPDGAAFGSGNAAFADDPDAAGFFTGVLDCPAHALYALVGVKPPQQDTQSGGQWEFTNCTMKGNRSTDEGVAAATAVAELFNRYNINDAQAVLFNIAGEALDTSYDFKWITYYPSIEAWGSLFDGVVGDGAVQEIGAIVDPVMECDSSRIYNGTVIRTAAAEAE